MGLTRAIVTGALAGFAATVPMTALMEVLHRQLPGHERYPLPPGEITSKVAEEAGVDQHLDQPRHLAVTLAAHFGYGAAVGAIYGPLSRLVPLPRPISGLIYGLGVWLTSYLGLLPALGILRPATGHPPRRNWLMIAAHLVWGVAAGLAVDAMPHNDRDWPESQGLPAGVAALAGRVPIGSR